MDVTDFSIYYDIDSNTVSAFFLLAFRLPALRAFWQST